MLRKIAFIYNSVPKHDRVGVFAECATETTITAVEQALIQGGNETISINLRSPQQLEQVFAERGKPDFAFVIAEGFLDCPVTLYDGSGAAKVREVLAGMKIPCSHSSVAAMELCRHKERTYQTLGEYAVSIPWHISFSALDRVDEVIAINRYPLFVKPSGGGNSVGIDEGSVIHSPAELKDRIDDLVRRLGPISFVAESFLPGIEYTVGIIGNNPVVLPPVAFPKNIIRTTEVKKLESCDKIPVQIIDPREPLYLRLRDLALRTFTALGCADAVRIDIKTDVKGELYVIDVNGTPSLGPVSSMTRMARAIGLDYPEFINLLLFNGLTRTGLAGAMPEHIADAEEKLNILRLNTPVVA